MNIEYIGAGAGSGKTYTVTRRIGEALLNGDCEPSGLIATTYTKKAANELRQRIRSNLFEQGRPDLAARMDEALIGTVHRVCSRILQRHAFAAGISPQLDVIDENNAVIAMNQIADLAATQETTDRLQELSELLDQRDSRTKSLYWHRQLHAVLAQIRANDFSLEDLPEMAERTADEYLALGGAPAEAELDAGLLATLSATITSLPADGDPTKKTTAAIRDLERLRDQAEGGILPWSAWIHLSKVTVGKKSEDLVAELNEIAAHYPAHPRYQSDIRDYLNILFGLAQETLARFQAHKQERGLVDYSDLEHLTYHLLRDQEDVRTTCAAQIQLLVVDEFQDTSPLQMALFLQLAECANQTLWVGDVKQSIYGFRGSDPQLVDGAVRRLREENRLGQTLAQSWRSVPELVHLTNELFAKPFEDSIGATPEDVKLDPVRLLVEREHPPIEFLHASTGETTGTGEPKKVNKGTIVEAIAQRVSEILSARPRQQVGIKGTEGQDEQLREIQPGDIAILCRKKDFGKEIAQALSKRGIAVSLSAPGLMDTPEVSLALAGVRMITDQQDTLARAEVLSLGLGQPLEQVLADRIAYVQSLEKGARDEWGLAGDSANEVLPALFAERGRTSIDSPSAILDRAMTVGQIWETVSQWGPDPVRAAQRRANLEALRGLCRQYEESCHSSYLPATVGGFLSWCAQLNDDQADNQAADPSPDAVQIATYHAAKGLEWPIVICTQLDSTVRDEWPNVQVVPTGDGTVDFEEPLANRTLHFWPSPFNLTSKDFGHLETIRNSEPVRRIQARAENEALRLLYVGITRARDQLILVTGDKLQNKWLDSLGTDWLQADDGTIHLPGGMNIPCREKIIIPESSGTTGATTARQKWFPSATDPTSKQPASRVPSAAEPVSTASVVEVAEYGQRLPVTGTVDDTALGNALHNFLAYDLLSPGQDDRLEVARRLITNHGLGDNLTAPNLIDSSDRFSREIERRFQPKRTLVEVPFHHTNDAGQSVTGFIDLLLETEAGWVLIDHKSFRGTEANREAKALTYSGQLQTYRAALSPHGIKVSAAWIHFISGGALMRVDCH
ncbi:MAG: ATP-dependent helicase/nuclease subunit A [Limisphaerales bacterium]|jgi:ATP-dependent helicase/nuclease subunit A